MNIHDSLKTYLLFTQTNRVEGVCVRDGAITPADWSCDVAKLTGKVNETKHRWTNSTKARSRSTHQLTYMCTTLHQHAAAHMDDWAWFLVWMLLFPATGRRQKRGRWQVVLFAVKLNYYTKLCQAADTKINRKLLCNGKFFFLCAKCVMLHCNLIFPLSAIHQQRLQGLKWISENKGAHGFWQQEELCRGAENFWME